MSETEVRIIILEVFEEIRQSPGAPFEEAHFLNFLLQPPSAKDNLKSSFKATKKYYDFFRAVELRFGICFSYEDQDKPYSVDKFVKKTKERIDNSRGNKMIIQRRMSENVHYYLEIFFTIVLVLLVWYFKMHVVSAVAMVLWALAMGWLLRRRIQDTRHEKALYKKIMGNDYSKGV